MAMLDTTRQFDGNLEGLRSDLTLRCAYLIAICGALFTWFTLIRWPFPVAPFLMGVLLIAGAFASIMVMKNHPVAARYALGFLPLVVVMTAMWFSPEPWLPFLLVPIILMNAILLPIPGAVGMAAATLLAVWLVRSGLRVYPLEIWFVVCALVGIISWLVVHTLLTALRWASATQLRADALLTESQNRQIELNRAVKSLQLLTDLQKRTEFALADAYQQAEDARLMKEQFASNISHELRTPLNLIMGFSEILYLSPEVYGVSHWPTNLRRDIHHIYRSSRHLMEMINDILDLSRFEVSGFTLSKEPTPVSELLAETAEIARDLFRNHPAEFEVSITPQLPSLDLDRTRVRQIVLNLLNNAKRHTQAGTVKLEAWEENGNVLISVCDTGPGIALEQQEQIFEEFYQADSSVRQKRSGVGLGLAISKRFVEAHAGRIWVESEVDHGARFVFSLPIETRIILAPAYSENYLPRIDASADSYRCIIVVDPDPDVAVLVDRLLAHYEIIHTSDTTNLYELTTNYRPRTILYNDSIGYEAVTEALGSTIVPLIGCALPSRWWLAADMKVEGILGKPVTVEQLMSAFDKMSDVRTLLVIDDDRGFVQLVDRIISAHRSDIEVLRAFDGFEGLQLMRERQPDLVYLDLQMPLCDGYEVLETIRKEQDLQGIPVILLTARSLAEDLLESRQDSIVIGRQNGLRLNEMLQCVDVISDVLEPRYDIQLTPGERLPSDIMRAIPPMDVRFSD